MEEEGTGGGDLYRCGRRVRGSIFGLSRRAEVHDVRQSRRRIGREGEQEGEVGVTRTEGSRLGVVDRGLVGGTRGTEVEKGRSRRPCDRGRPRDPTSSVQVGGVWDLRFKVCGHDFRMVGASVRLWSTVTRRRCTRGGGPYDKGTRRDLTGGTGGGFRLSW